MSAKEDKLYFLIQLVAHRLKKSADNRLIESTNMTTAQSAVMTLIVANQPVNQRYLATTLAQNESAITAMVSRLVKLGYVSKTKSETDGRAWLLEATEQGEAVLKDSGRSFDQVNQMIDSAFQGESTASFTNALNSLLKQLDGSREPK